jgi:glycine/D-amino acid oxidase-like deaminating enzyme
MPDVVVVGGGVVGASVAWHLARSGVRDVLLLERGATPGEGSTGRATGGFRAQFGTDINVRLSLLAREKLRRFRDEPGGDAGYRPCGYLWLCRTQDELRAMRDAQQVQHAAGLAEARMVDAREIAALNPAANLQDVAGGAFCPTDGFVRPLGILDGYLDGARRLGVRIRTAAEVVGLRRGSSGLIESVRLPDEDIRCGTVVNAAGPWAHALGALAGLEVPVKPLRRQVACTVPSAALPEDMPMTIWVADGFHLRVRDGRVLLLQPTAEAPGFSTRVDPAWVASVRELASRRVPALAGIDVDEARCWAGSYEMSPDGHALLGPAPGCENLFLVNGSSGHGVMHAPALGALAAEWIEHGEVRSLDARPLRASRFLEGEPIGGPSLL